jgi:hypothetical protein
VRLLLAEAFIRLLLMPLLTVMVKIRVSVVQMEFKPPSSEWFDTWFD